MIQEKSKISANHVQLKETQTTLGPRCLEKQNPVLREKKQKGSKGLQEAKSEQGTNTPKEQRD